MLLLHKITSSSHLKTPFSTNPLGTTDHKQKATMRPEPDESEIRWLLTEAAKYLSPELHMRRKDVLSAW